jgi:WD40 repeat protein
LEDHKGWVFVLATSPNGRWLASGSSDSTVILWDLISRKRVLKFLGHSGGILALAFSPDGGNLASGGFDQIVRLWDLNKENPTALLRGHRGAVTRLSFSPDGQSLLSGSWDGLIKRWHATSGLRADVLIGRPEGQNDVALSPDGRLLASVSAESFAVNLWDLSTRSPMVLTGHSKAVSRAAFSPDGKILATASFDQTVRLWDVEERKSVATLTNGFQAGSLAFSPDGRTLIVGSSWLHTEGLAGLEFWDVPSRRATGTVPGDASTNIVEVALSSDGTLLATGHEDGDVSLWEAQTRRLLRRFKRRLGWGAVISLAFSPTEPLLVAGNASGIMEFYNTATMAEIGEPLRAHTFGAGDLAFTPDGRTLASYGDGGGGVKLWPVATRQLALTLKGHPGFVSGIVFSRDGNLMASCGADSTVRLWPAATLEEADAATEAKKKTQ